MFVFDIVNNNANRRKIVYNLYSFKNNYKHKLLIIFYFLIFKKHKNIVFERYFDFDTTQNIYENLQQLQFAMFFIAQDDLFCEKYILNNFYIYIEK